MSENINKENKTPKIKDTTVRQKLHMNQETNVISEGSTEKMDSTDKSITVTPATAEGKTKSQLRAERRAKQEAQRAAKAQKQQEKPTKAPTNTNAKPTQSVQEKTDQNVADIQNEKAETSVVLNHKISMNAQVKNYGKKSASPGDNRKTNIVDNFVGKKIQLSLLSHGAHPAIVSLGIQYRDHVILGSNARCLAFLEAVKQVIRDYKTPPEKEFSRSLDVYLQFCVDFLNHFRQASVSMCNALRHVKWQLTQLSTANTELEAKKKINDAIDIYIREQIEVADDAICEMGSRKICNGDNILVYGYSYIVYCILLKAYSENIDFHVTVVGSRPTEEGKNMLCRLVKEGIRCSYILIPAVSFMMREVTKVFLGAHALLANGYVMSRVGSSQIALVARAHNVPVLVFCETHKFSERVQTDSFVWNDYGNPDALVKSNFFQGENPLKNWKDEQFLTPLCPMYDVTPPDLVTAVMTELGILPCTSVPVVLRIKPSESGM